MSNRTYLQHGALSAYPFLAGASLPFSYSCIYAIGVCTRPFFGTGTKIAATGVELAETGVSITLSWLSADGRSEEMCTLSAAVGEYDHAAEVGSYNAWLCAGSVPPSAYGSHAGRWLLDPSCVVFADTAILGQAVEISCGPGDAPESGPAKEILSVSAEGMLGLRLLPESGGGARLAVLYTDIPDSVETVSVEAEPVQYVKVQELNGVQPAETCDTIWLTAASPDGGKAEDYVTFDIHTDGIYGKATSMSGSDEPQDSLAERMSIHGGSVIVSVNGHKKVPNCFDPDKDSAKD